MADGREVVVAETAQPAVSEAERPQGFLTRKILEELKEQVALRREAALILISLTTPKDWTNLGDKPYLTESGVSKIASVIGVQFSEPQIEESAGDDAQGHFIEYTCRLEAMWRGKVLPEIGTSTTRDQFFARANGEDLPFEKINRMNVKKKCVTNAHGRALTKMLGLRGLSWDEITARGVDRPTESVRFKGGERKAATGAGGWSEAKKNIWGMLLEMSGGDEAAAGERLFGLTDNPEKQFPGKRDPQQLSEKAAAWVSQRVGEQYRKWSDAQAQPAQRQPGEEG